MPVTLEYHEDTQILVLSFISPWTADEALATYPPARQYFDTAPAIVNTIVDITKIGNIPLDALSARRNSPFISHPKSGVIIIVGGHTFARTMAETVFMLAHFKRVKFVDAMQEAYDYLHNQQS